MGARAIVACLLASLVAASAPGQMPSAPADVSPAQREQAAAEAELARLERIARQTKDHADRIAADRRAAAAGIEAAEARITAAEQRISREDARLAVLEGALARSQRPVTALLGGLAMMGGRPPILALADRGGVDEMVRARILLDSTVPVVRRQSAAVAGQIRTVEAQRRAAARARRALVGDRRLLAERQRRLASLEDAAAADALQAGGAALAAGDAVLAGRDRLDRRGRDGNARLARELLAESPVPAIPRLSEGAAGTPHFAYNLPADAVVARGFANVGQGGIRARGITLATERGMPVAAPAAGVVRYAGPFDAYLGIAIIDHGDGWLSVITNVATTAREGQRLGEGERFARALGPIDVELSRNGRHLSPALIAGSSAPLFKGR